jgi:hypothetical protein
MEIKINSASARASRPLIVFNSPPISTVRDTTGFLLLLLSPKEAFISTMLYSHFGPFERELGGPFFWPAPRVGR